MKTKRDYRTEIKALSDENLMHRIDRLEDLSLDHVNFGVGTRMSTPYSIKLAYAREQARKRGLIN